MSGYNNDDSVAWTEDALGNPTDNTYDPLDRVLLSSTDRIRTAPDP